MSEGGGFLARDAPLGQQAEHLRKSAADAGDGREIAAGGIEFGEIERGADDVARGRGFAEELLFAFGVKGTERGVNVGAEHAALASIGEGELAAPGHGFGRDGLRRGVFEEQREVLRLGWFGVRGETMAVRRFLCGRHMQCYCQSK